VAAVTGKFLFVLAVQRLLLLSRLPTVCLPCASLPQFHIFASLAPGYGMEGGKYVLVLYDSTVLPPANNTPWKSTFIVSRSISSPPPPLIYRGRSIGCAARCCQATCRSSGPYIDVICGKRSDAGKFSTCRTLLNNQVYQEGR